MNSISYDENCDAWYQEIYNLSKANGIKKCAFSMSEIDADKLNDVAIQGTVTFVNKADDYFGDEDSRDFIKTMTNPTYLDLWKACDEMIYTTRDFHHIFFEAFHKNKDGTYFFSMGS